MALWFCFKNILLLGICFPAVWGAGRRPELGHWGSRKV